MKKSWKVEYDGNFSNERGKHVETPEEGLEGKSFALGKRSVKMMRGGVNYAVMYHVVGLKNGKFVSPFFFTVDLRTF